MDNNIIIIGFKFSDLKSKVAKQKAMAAIRRVYNYRRGAEVSNNDINKCRFDAKGNIYIW